MATRTKLRVLFVADHDVWPLTSGLAQRLYHLSTGLARTHTVDLIVMSPDAGNTDFPGAESFRSIEIVPYRSCRFAAEEPSGGRSDAARVWGALTSRTPEVVRRFDSPLLRTRAAYRITASDTDVVWASRGHFAEQIVAVTSTPVIADVADVESQVREREARGHPSWRLVDIAERRRVRRWERRLPERVATVVVCKPEDRRYFRGGDVAVVPNGALAPAMLPNEDRAADDVLFIGNLEYQPNIDAVRHFAQDVLPLVHRRRPSTRFVVAGRNPGPDVKALHDNAGVVVHDTPPDLECLYASAAIVVIPIRMGGGTRVKTIEAMMYAKAVVTTPAGREGIDARPGIDLLEASTPEAFADACVTLLDDAERRRALGASARSLTIHRCHWDRSVEEAERLVERVARAGPDVPR